MYLKLWNFNVYIFCRFLTFLLMFFQKIWIWWYFREVFPCWNVFNITYYYYYYYILLICHTTSWPTPSVSGGSVFLFWWCRPAGSPSELTCKDIPADWAQSLVSPSAHLKGPVGSRWCLWVWSVMRIWMLAPPGQATGPSEVSAGFCSVSVFSTHTAAAQLPCGFLLFSCLLRCAHHLLWGNERSVTFPASYPLPVNRPIFLKLNPHAARTTALWGD